MNTAASKTNPAHRPQHAILWPLLLRLWSSVAASELRWHPGVWLVLAIPVFWCGCATPTPSYPGTRLPKDKVAVLRADKPFLSAMDRLSIESIDGNNWSHFDAELLPGTHTIGYKGALIPLGGEQLVFSGHVTAAFLAGHEYDLIGTLHGGFWGDIRNWSFDIKAMKPDKNN